MTATSLTFTQLLEDIVRRPRAIRVNSRDVQPGDIFVALPSFTPGKPEQRAEHIREAAAHGAAFVLTENFPGLPQFAPSNSPSNLPSNLSGTATGNMTDNALGIITVPDVREALGLLAAACHGTSRLPFPLVGMTGTNGKTTCAYLLEHLYRSTGRNVGVLGTVSYRWPGHEEPAPLTTPGCLAVHEYMAAMRDAGVDAAIMEVASHALDQKRIAGLHFSGALFTNLTQDHLDYHGTMEQYFAAKTLLFSDVPNLDKAIAINADDPYGQRLLAEFPAAVGYGFATPSGSNNGLVGTLLADTPDGLSLDLTYGGVTWNLTSPLVGKHNAANLMGVMALALNMGFTPADFSCFHNFFGVSGRLERIPTPASGRGAGAGIFVDYAHTPDALIRAQEALRDAGFTRLITVFGCGGDRDRTKRPVMGAAVAGVSDIAIVTSDNPRCEDPEAIINDIMPGLAKAAEVHRELDRRRALHLALELVRPGDALLVAGKGHETYQIIGTTKHPFSDQNILKELLSCS